MKKPLERSNEQASLAPVRRGSHLKLRSDQGRIVIVPLHRELATGTLRSIIRQSGLSADEFVESL